MTSRQPFHLDTLLLMALVTSHMWFNSFSNMLVVIGLFVYVGLDLWLPDADPDAPPATRRQRFLFLTRLTIVFFVVAVAAVLPTGYNMIQRAATNPAFFAHDGLIQTEIAIEYLLDGRNPYTEDYINTPMADFPGNEPPFTDAPLYHNAYLPFLFIGSIPFYSLSHSLWEWYDQRIVYLLAYFGVILLLPQLVAGTRNKLAAVIAVGLNYLFTFYLADGRNDVVILFGLVLAAYFLAQQRWILAGVVLGLTMATKHQAWFFLPFYLVYLLPKQPKTADFRRLIVQLLPVALTAALVLLPFLAWDFSAFIEDTVTYVTGSGTTSFPMKGWGFSTLLVTFGLVPSPEAAFPFSLFELLFGLPVLLFMLRRQWRDNSLQNAWLGFALFSFTFQFFSRFFNDNYFVFVLELLLIVAFLKPIYATHDPQNPA